MALADVFQRVAGPDAPVEFQAYDGSKAGAADAPVKITVRSPIAVSYLAQAPGALGLARAYVSGHLDVVGDMYSALARMARAQMVHLDFSDHRHVPGYGHGHGRILRIYQSVVKVYHVCGDSIAEYKIVIILVLRPERVAFFEAARGELLRFHFLIRVLWRVHDPDVLRMFRIEVTLVIFAIDCACDHSDVTLVFRFGFGFLNRGLPLLLFTPRLFCRLL